MARKLNGAGIAEFQVDDHPYFSSCSRRFLHRYRWTFVHCRPQTEDQGIKSDGLTVLGCEPEPFYGEHNLIFQSKRAWQGAFLSVLGEDSSLESSDYIFQSWGTRLEHKTWWFR